MRKMILRPDADGYSAAEPDGEVLRVDLDGGAGRYRTDKIGATKTVNVKWTMNPARYEYWRSFFETGTKRGALSFLCDLVSEDGLGPVEHTCSFIPGSVSLPTQQGLTYVQQATLEVTPIAHDPLVDVALMDLFELYEDKGSVILNKLAKLVTVDLVPGLEDA